MSFGSMLKNLRKGKKMTQEELAYVLRMSKSAISMYENGKRTPDFETLEIFADYFNVDMNTLLDRNPSNWQDNNDELPPVPRIAKVPPPVPEGEKENLLLTMFADHPEIIQFLKDNGFVLRGNLAAIGDEGRLLLKHAILSSIENEQKEQKK